jgi:hypothetical protein
MHAILTPAPDVSLEKAVHSSRATSPIGSKANSPSGRHRSMKLRFAILKASNHSGATSFRIPSGLLSPLQPKLSPILRQAGNILSTQHPSISHLLPGLKAPPSASPVQEPEGSCSLRALRDVNGPEESRVVTEALMQQSCSCGGKNESTANVMAPVR